MAMASSSIHAARVKAELRWPVATWPRRLRLVLLVILMLAGGIWYGTAGARAFANDFGAGSGLAGLAVGQIVGVGVLFETRPSAGTIVMRGVTFPKPLSPHLHVLRQVAIHGEADIVLWPLEHSITAYPLDGYRVGPYSDVSAVLVLTADAPGIYTIGPFILHADTLGIFGSGIGVISMSYTINGKRTLCYDIPPSGCFPLP